MTKWDVYSLNVIGNAENGYEVNDRRRVGKIHLPKEFDETLLMKILKDEGLLTYEVNDLKRVRVGIAENYISVDYRGKPFIELENE